MDRRTKAHIHRYRRRNQSAFTLVPPPPSKTCGQKAEKIAWHPLPWSMKLGQEEGGKTRKGKEGEEKQELKDADCRKVRRRRNGSRREGIRRW